MMEEIGWEKRERSGRVKYLGEEFGKWKKISNSPQLNTDVDVSVYGGITGLRYRLPNSLKILCAGTITVYVTVLLCY